MVVYHITGNYNIEECVDSTCVINKKLHFNGLSKALQSLDMSIEQSSFNHKNNIKVGRYDGEVNYNSGVTTHYRENRILREKVLVDLLGQGNKIKAFIVKEGDDNIQIQELLDNAVLVIYSFHTHRKITLFAPHPERIMSLYASIGEFPPDWLIKKSESNSRKGHNNIHSE